MEHSSEPIHFFTEEDFKTLESVAGKKKDNDNSAHQEAYNRLVQVYNKVDYWARQVQQRTFPEGYVQIRRRPTNQANNFSEYLWAKIYPDRKVSAKLAFTVEINTYRGFTVKIDTVSLAAEDPVRLEYMRYRGENWDASEIVRHFPKTMVNSSWEELIQKTEQYVMSIRPHYEKLAHEPGLSISSNPEAERADQSHYWFLSYNPHNWRAKFSKNLVYHFHGHGDYFIRNLRNARIGDYIFGFANEEGARSVCIFKVTREYFRSGHLQREVILFSPVYISPIGISYRDIAENKNISGDFKSDRFKTGFYNLDEASFMEILNKFDIDLEDIEAVMSAQPFTFTNDADPDKTANMLDSENDIEVLAALISYKEIAPPLAIGLFGDWGTGKSYFMHHLAKRIEGYAESQDDAFCKNVIKIQFNSWHYIDTNLWASLVTHIFESIYAHLDKQFGSGDKSESEKLFASLNSTQIIIKEKEDEQETISQVIDDLNQQLAVIRAKKTEISDEKLMQGFFEDSDVKDRISEIKKKFFGPALTDIHVIESQISQLGSLRSRIIKAFDNISKYNCKEVLWFVICPALLFLLPWLLPVLFGTTLGKWLPFVSSGTNKIVFALGAFIFFLRPVNKVLDRFEALHEKLQKLKREKLSEKDEGKTISEKIEEYKAQEEALNKKIAELHTKVAKLETDIADIKSGKRIYGWVAERMNSQDYKKHLGIISTIRQDFEMLDALMLDQKKANELSIKDQLENPPQAKSIERIVLFIDDLDRCPESRVVEVLQAVHLLMAFKLFVVVVGVDSRWLKNAIDYEYRNELGKKSDNKGRNHTIKANDYLEKIFQITFRLRKMSVVSSANLITYLTSVDETLAGSPVGLGQDSRLLRDMMPAETQEPRAEILNPGDTPKEKQKNGSRINPSELALTEYERKMMIFMAPLISSSPRALKRFVNMYRMVRAHNNFREIYQGEKHYEVALLFLALTLGANAEAHAWIKLLLRTQNNELFSDIQPMPSVVTELAPQVGSILQYEISHYKDVLGLVDRFGFNDEL